MNSFAPAEKLRQHRPILLACEAIGWFHMAGKARMEFLRQHGGDHVQYDYKRWHTAETPPFDWDAFLGWMRSFQNSQIPSSAWPGSVAKFIEEHAGRSPGMLGVLQAAHGMASGIEKNLPASASGYLSQLLPHMWLASPFGYPKRNLFTGPPEVLSEPGWKQVVAEIKRILEELQQLASSNAQDVSHWAQWREEAIGSRSYIRRAFLSTIAETRLPNNDVTLWDQSYVAAALFKSAVAGALLDSAFPWEDNQLKQRIRWRLLTVAVGADHYEARAVKIGDWTGMQGALEEFFRRVSQLVEVDLAAGSLLYQDSTTLVFSFPGEGFDEGVPANWVDGFKQWIEGEIHRIAQALNFETPPLVRLSGPTRSLVPIVPERREAQKIIAIPIHKQWGIHPSSADGHVCPVCQVRLNGDPTDKGRPCTICRQRRHHRRDDWLSGRLAYDTIWFEEVADHNDRIALLTFALDLEPWLNGECVDSLRAQAIPEWRRFNPVLSSTPNPVDPARPFEWLWAYIQSKLSQFDRNDPVLRSLQEGYQHEPHWPTFFKKIVEDRAEAPDWNSLNDSERAAWIAHQLFRKLPSPGRVYRFWREAQEFFKDLLDEFRQIAARSENLWRLRRLLLKPRPNCSPSSWQDGTLYEGGWRALPLSLVYVRALDGFLTVSNLARLLRAEERADVLQGQEILLKKEEDTFGRPETLIVEQAQEVPSRYAHLAVYHPVILLELSPLRFRVVVPLEAASECVDLALARWKEAFARVGDRLPLGAGIVAFDRTVPFQAVVEAVRHLEERLARPEEEPWTVVQNERCPEAVALALRRPDGQTRVRVVPVRMPDGREDVFYPYVKVKEPTLRYPLDFRHPNGTVYRHAKDLGPGDEVTIIPACVGFLFMESAGARFEEASLLHAADWEEMRAIWDRVVRTAPSQSAVQRLRSNLARLEQDWGHPAGQAAPDLWRDTLRALIASHLEAKGAALETLTDAAVRGLLQRALDWHMTALKRTV